MTLSPGKDIADSLGGRHLTTLTRQTSWAATRGDGVEEAMKTSVELVKGHERVLFTVSYARYEYNRRRRRRGRASCNV